MTGEQSGDIGRSPLTGPLGRRLLAAFVLVALSAVAVLTGAALVGTDRGLASAQRDARTQAARRVAAAAAAAYVTAGGWTGADLDPASAIAEAAGAGLVIRDTTGAVAWPGHGMGPGGGMMHTEQLGSVVVEAPIMAAGQRVGTARLGYPSAVTGGRAVAWSWVLSAALVALAVALAVSWYVSRRLTRPLVTLADATRRFAAGERAIRVGGSVPSAPGELGEVGRAFDTMADEVVRADSVRRHLAADVAHELRTPLAGLQAGLEELRDGLREPDTQRLAALHDQTLRLGRVVQDLADLAAAESAALSLRPIATDLTEIAGAALAATEPQLSAAGLHIDADLRAPVPLRADPDRLHQAITNLLTNAARYCHPGDHVAIRTHTDRDSAVLVVSDTGPGIPAADLPHVFERLWRGPHNGAVAGSGIGLAVVRELVTAHHGDVTLTSPPGHGTTVTVRLPGNPLPREPEAAAEASQR